MSVPAPTRRTLLGATSRRLSVRRASARLGRHRFSLTLARRFLVANLAILLIGGIAIGAWVGDQLERGIIDRTASITALYVESFIEPPVESLATGQWLSGDDTASLDRILDSTSLGERIVALKIWSPAGVVLYSADHQLIGQAFPIDEGLAAALNGQVHAEMSRLDQAENVIESEQFDRLLEMYVPVRERGSDRIIAAAEFYQLPTEIDAQVADARWRAWVVVAIAVVGSYLLLYGVVRQGSDTITRQRRSLETQVAQLTALNEQNEALNDRVRQAAERSTTLSERALRRIGSDLHDGPGQMLSLALMRIGTIRGKEPAGDPEGVEREEADVESALRDALREMRVIAAGLRLPELEPMASRAVVERAVDDHRRRSGTPVSLTFDEGAAAPPERLDLAVKIALFRALQELLSNATRHGEGTNVRVSVGAIDLVRRAGTALRLVVSDDGPGFSIDDLPPTASSHTEVNGLGLAGVREGAELLGGGFSLRSAPGSGTSVEVWWPLGVAISVHVRGS